MNWMCGHRIYSGCGIRIDPCSLFLVPNFDSGKKFVIFRVDNIQFLLTIRNNIYFKLSI